MHYIKQRAPEYLTIFYVNKIFGILFRRVGRLYYVRMRFTLRDRFQIKKG